MYKIYRMDENAASGWKQIGAADNTTDLLTIVGFYEKLGYTVDYLAW